MPIRPTKHAKDAKIYLILAFRVLSRVWRPLFTKISLAPELPDLKLFLWHKLPLLRTIQRSKET